MSLKWDSVAEAWQKLSSQQEPYWGKYKGFYSSYLGGFFCEPYAMVLPLDDHGFHRGDGVFEAVRAVNGAYFDLDTHLERLETSANALGLHLPHSLEFIHDICVQLARRVGEPDGLLRLFVTRGAGSFSPNPFDSQHPGLYAVWTALAPPSESLYQNGCRAMLSEVQAKDPFWSQIKSFNYLPNVLMKKQCVEAGYDLAIGLTREGWVAEGATENLFVVDQNDRLWVPPFDYTLRGTTVRVVMELAKELVKKGRLKDVGHHNLSREDLLSARELAFVGTTLAVLPVCSIDSQPIGDGSVGPIARELGTLLREVMSRSTTHRTPF